MTLPNHSDPAALEDAVIICALGLETQLLLAQCLDYGLLREAKQAQQFYERARQQKLPTVIDRDGIIRIYDPKTNSFGVYNADGTTRTFFKPRAGARYFQNVINDVLSRGGRMLHPFQPTGGTG
ncbi:MAG: hypothetical protein KDD76_07035, partial [Rickettsiales bacterium]|nr:hypothetical protein [Rickettsiales bacterium]